MIVALLSVTDPVAVNVGVNALVGPLLLVLCPLARFLS